MLLEITWPGRDRPGIYVQQIEGREVLLSFNLDRDCRPFPLASEPANIPLELLDLMVRNLEDEIERIL